MRGVSLLETILGLFLLSLLILMVFNLYPSSLLSVRRAEENQQADLLAQSVLDYQAARPFDQLVAGSLYQVEQPFKGCVLQATAEIYDLPGTRPDLLRRIRVAVSWGARSRDYLVTHEVLLPYVAR